MNSYQTSSPILEVKNLTISYESQKAVADMSFTISRGEIFGLLGPNGAGKTSCLSAIEGLVVPDNGTVTVNGKNFKDHPYAVRSDLGIQLQSTSFHSELTILEIVRLYAGLYGVELDESKTAKILEDMGLAREAHKRYKELSGGQEQRVSLIIATIHNPPLLLLDEPTTGLDPQSRRNLWDRIEKARGEGRSVLLTTHSMEEAESVCDRIAIIDHGAIIATDTPANLISRFATDPQVIAVSRGNRVTLEDVFIGLTGRQIRS